MRAGHLWAGNAKVPDAVGLATAHGLTLLRYDSDHTPTWFVRKGEVQPALASLEAEYLDSIERLRQMLLPAGAGEPNDAGNGNRVDPAGDDAATRQEEPHAPASAGEAAMADRPARPEGRATAAFVRPGPTRRMGGPGGSAANGA